MATSGRMKDSGPRIRVQRDLRDKFLEACRNYGNYGDSARNSAGRRLQSDGYCMKPPAHVLHLHAAHYAHDPRLFGRGGELPRHPHHHWQRHRSQQRPTPPPPTPDSKPLVLNRKIYTFAPVGIPANSTTTPAASASTNAAVGIASSFSAHATTTVNERS